MYLPCAPRAVRLPILLPTHPPAEPRSTRTPALGQTGDTSRLSTNSSQHSQGQLNRIRIGRRGGAYGYPTKINLVAYLPSQWCPAHSKRQWHFAREAGQRHSPTPWHAGGHTSVHTAGTHRGGTDDNDDETRRGAAGSIRSDADLARGRAGGGQGHARHLRDTANVPTPPSRTRSTTDALGLYSTFDIRHRRGHIRARRGSLEFRSAYRRSRQGDVKNRRHELRLARVRAQDARSDSTLR